MCKTLPATLQTENPLDNIIQIIPARPQNRLYILKSTAIGLIIPTLAVAIHFILHGQKQYNSIIATSFLTLFFILILSINIFTKKTQTVILNYKDKLLQLKYLTIFKTDNELIIPFDKLSFIYKIKHSKYPPTKYSLKLFNDSTKVFEIVTEYDGFNKEQIDDIVNKLELMDIKGSR